MKLSASAVSDACIYPITFNSVANISSTAYVSSSSEMWYPMVANYSTYIATNTCCYFKCNNFDKGNAYNRTHTAIVLGF